jgi:peptidyl-prolyl cis-trans isomerase C
MRSRIWTLASLAGAAFLAALASAGPAHAQANNPKPAAVVNNEPISLAEVDTILRTHGGPMPVEIPEAKRREMRREVLGMMIDDLLLEQYLRKNGPRVEQAEVDKEITDLEAGLKKQNKTLADFLKENGMPGARLKEQVITGLQWRAFAKAHVSDKDVEEYYRLNKDFFDGVTVRASHIVLRVPANASEADVLAAKKKLVAIREEINSNKITFADAARKYSQCESSKDGGDVSWFPRKWVIDEEFAKAAFATPVGGTTDIVRSSYGVHLIKVTDRKAGQPSDFSKIKDDVREICTNDLRQRIVAELRKQAKIEMNLP